MYMPAPVSKTNTIDDLRAAIQRGDAESIRAAMPEPPGFLSQVFVLEPDDMNKILAGVFSVLETDEDRWEIIEAAAMNTISQPERNAFLAVVPYIPQDLLADVYRLMERMPDSDAIKAVRRELDKVQ